MVTRAERARLPPSRDWLVQALVLLAISLSASVAAAQPSGKPKLVAIDVGLDGAYKVGCWTPLELTILGGDEPLVGVAELTIADGDGVPVRYTSQPAQLTPGRTTPIVTYVRFGQVDAKVNIVFRTAEKIVWETDAEADALDGGPTFASALSSDDRLVLCVGRQLSATLQTAVGGLSLHRGGRLTVIAVDDPRRLPTRWYGYEAVDALIFAPDGPESFAALPADSAQIAAARTWLELGGRVWLVASSDTKPLLAADAPLGRFAHLTLGEDVPLPRSDALEKLTGRTVKVGIVAAELKRKPLLVPRLSTDDAVVEAAEGDLPLVLRKAVGLGSLLVTSFSPEQPLLKSWPGRQAVVRQMLVQLDALDESELDQSNVNNTYNRWGYSDLAGQLSAALNQFEGVQVISFFTLAVMVLFYLVLIGPVDYLLVRKVFKRTELTWFTFPTIVLVTSLGAYLLAVWMKGDQIRVSRADVIDCDAADGVIRGTSYAGVFSPVGRTYDVGFQPPANLLGLTMTEIQTTWLGMPGDGLGGMQRGGAPQWFTRTYEPSPDGASLLGAPIQVWSSKMFQGRWHARAAASLHGPLLEKANGRLDGVLRNPFSCTVDDALLCYGSNAYEVGTLAAGGTFDLSAAPARDLQSVLQGWHIVLSEKKNPINVARPHDPASRDVAEILQKMMFYAASGAREHANLEHRYQAFLDGSELLSERRAVLAGRIDPDDGATLRLSTGGSDADRAADRRTTFVRLVIPVTPQ